MLDVPWRSDLSLSEGRLQWSTALSFCKSGLESCVELLVVCAATKSHLILLLIGIKLKFACVACGYKLSSNIAFNWHRVNV